MLHQSRIQFTAPFLCFALLAACGSSSTKSPSDGGAAGAGGSSAAGAGGSSAAGAGGSSAAGAGGSSAAGAGGSSAAGAGGSSADAAAGAGGSAVDGAAGATDSGSDVIATDSGVDAVACPMIANIATTFTDTSASGAVPVGTGGAISDGTYTMTGNVIYMSGSTNGKTHTYTFQITGTTMAVTGHDSEDNGDSSGSFTLTTNPTTGTMSVIGFCPAGNVGKNLGNIDSYTATATVIHAYASSKNNEIILTKH